MKLLILLTLFAFSKGAFGQSSFEVEKVIKRSQEILMEKQKAEGHWDLPSFVGPQYVSFFYLFEKWLQLPVRKIESLDEKIFFEKVLAEQLPNGGWNTTTDALFRYKGDLDATILHYFALKVFGMNVHSKEMEKARSYILSHGGIEKSTLLTKIYLCLFDNYNWDEIPYVPWLLFSDWNPLNYKKFAQWVTPHLMPIAYLRNLHVHKKLGARYNLKELFKKRFHSSNKLRKPGVMAKRLMSKIYGLQAPKGTWGGYAGATMLTLMATDHHLNFEREFASTQKISKAYSRVHSTLFRGDENDLNGVIYDGRFWDTALISTALVKSGFKSSQLEEPKDYLLSYQTSDGAFPFGFDFFDYPDCDQTSESLIALKHMKARPEVLERTANWLLGMQNKDGGWGAFDKDNNENFVLGHFVRAFNDSADLFDESSADVTAHVLESLGELGLTIKNSQSVRRGVAYLKKSQNKEGLWQGRWGINAIYGTGQALTALMKVGVSKREVFIQKAILKLMRHQNADGGFGESPMSYKDDAYVLRGVSTPTQTAWFLSALVATGHGDSKKASRAVQYLLEKFDDSTGWRDGSVVGTGHPGVLMIQYPSYAHAFSLMALADYLNALQME